MHTPRLTFLESSEPLSKQVADWLLARSPAELFDFVQSLVLVPTRNAGRLLRERLATVAADRGRALISPEVWTPGMLLAYALRDQPAASALELRLYLAFAIEQLLSDSHAGAGSPADTSLSAVGLPHLLPDTHGGEPDAAVFPRIAEMLAGLMDELAEGGFEAHSPELLSAVEGLCPDELGRWHDLHKLTRHCADLLQEAGRSIPSAIKVRWMEKPGLPPAIQHVVLAGLPDFPNGVARALEVLAGRMEIDVLVAAPGFASEERAAFDAWGRPNADFWTKTDCRVSEESIIVSSDPDRLAVEIEQSVGAAVSKGTIPAVVVVEPEILRPIRRALENVGVDVYDPAGRAGGDLAPVRYLMLAVELMADDQFDTVTTLARLPAVLGRMASAAGVAPGFFLARLDDFAMAHIPNRLAEAVALASRPGQAEVNAGLSSLCKGLSDARAADNAVAGFLSLLEWAYPSGGARLPAPEFEFLRSALLALREVSAPPDCDPRVILRLAVKQLAAGRIYPDAPDENSLELLGWLESLWFPGDQLDVCGLHDGRVPEQTETHPFLPDGLRSKLGLGSNSARHARDAYLLRALSGRFGTSLRLHTATGGSEGSSFAPSRLLFQGLPDERLLRLAQLLFPQASPPPQPPRRTAAWALRAPRPAPVQKLSVTAFRDFLTDPLQFLFLRLFGMNEQRGPALELSPAQSGETFHALMAELVREKGGSTDIAAAEGFLSGRLETVFAAKYGMELSLTLEVQKRSLRRRLFNAAKLLHEAMDEGWRVVGVEVPLLSSEKQAVLSVAGLTLTGRIDRIDWHPERGFRVVDYKTSNSATSAVRSHYRRWSERDSHWPDYVRFEVPKSKGEGTTLVRWLDLQLPLYAAAMPMLPIYAKLQGEFCGGDAIPIDAAYVMVPADSTKVCSSVLPAGELAAEALACAEGIIGSIRRDEFFFDWTEGRGRALDGILLRDFAGACPVFAKEEA